VWVIFVVLGGIQILGGVAVYIIGAGGGEPGMAVGGIVAAVVGLAMLGFADVLWTLGAILKTLRATAKYQRERDKSFL
jgi:hypothetical protein